MSNKKVILLIAIAFSSGFMMAEFKYPALTFAQGVTNYIYDELNGKITKANTEIDVLRGRLSTLEKSSQAADAKIANMTESIKKLLELQKSSLSDTELKKQVTQLKLTVNKMKEVQTLQQSAIKTLQAK